MHGEPNVVPEPLSDRAIAALNKIFNASQTGDPAALDISTKGLESLRERGVIEEWSGANGGRYLLVTAAGKLALRRAPAPARD